MKQKKNETLSQFMARNLAYYIGHGENRRCTVPKGAGCFYHPKSTNTSKPINENTEGCFVGRLIEDDNLKFLMDKDFDSLPEGYVSGDQFSEFDASWGGNIGHLDGAYYAHTLLKQKGLPKIISDNLGLMARFQNLHDVNHNWENNQLTTEGKVTLEKIIEDYKFDINDFDFAL